MAIPVVIVPSGGLPVTVAPNGYGVPMVVGPTGLAVTFAPNGLSVSGISSGPAVIPANTALPVISGATQVGNALSTTNGSWSGTFATYTYQWQRGGVNIAGATGNMYTLVTADLGAMISVAVTATNTAGNATATATAVGPVTGAAFTPTYYLYGF